MSFLQLLKASLFRFSDLKNANKTPFWKAVLYLLFLSLIMALPIVYQAHAMLDELKQDSTVISKKIPDFTIQDGKLKTSAKGFIYQTDSIIFTFDPEGKRTEKDVQKDLVGNLFSVGLLKDRGVLVLPESGAALLGSNKLTMPYSEEPLKSLTGQNLKAGIKEAKLPFWGYLLMLLVAIYPAFLNLVITLFFAAFGALIFSKLRLLAVGFGDCFKLIIFSATLPVLLATLISFFRPTFDTSTLITIASLFIFFQVSRSLAKKTL